MCILTWGLRTDEPRRVGGGVKGRFERTYRGSLAHGDCELV